MFKLVFNFFMYVYVAMSVMRIKCVNTGKMFGIILVHDKSRLAKEEEGKTFLLFTSFSSAKLGFCLKSPSGGIPPAPQNPKRRWAALCVRERKLGEVP